MRAWLPLFTGVLVASLVLLTPMRLALGWMDVERTGLTAQSVEGTIWRGVLRQAAWRGVGLGDARVYVAPWTLLGGAAGFGIVTDGAIRGRATVSLKRGSLELRGVDAVLPLAMIAPDLPIGGDLRLTDFRTDLRDGRCLAAAGRVAVERVTVAGAPGGLRMAGDASCRADVLSLPLSGSAAGLIMDARLEIAPNGAYRLETRLRTTDPLAAAGAEAAGFERTLDGLRRTDKGRLRGAS